MVICILSWFGQKMERAFTEIFFMYSILSMELNELLLNLIPDKLWITNLDSLGIFSNYKEVPFMI